MKKNEKKIVHRYQLYYSDQKKDMPISLQINSEDLPRDRFTLAEIDEFTSSFANKNELISYLKTYYPKLNYDGKICVRYKSKGTFHSLKIVYNDMPELATLATLNSTSSMINEKYLSHFTNYFIKQMQDEELKTYLVRFNYINNYIVSALVNYLDACDINKNVIFAYNKLMENLNRYKVIRGIEIGIHEFNDRKKKKELENKDKKEPAIYRLIYTDGKKEIPINFQFKGEDNPREYCTLAEIDTFTTNFDNKESIIAQIMPLYNYNLTIKGKLVIKALVNNHFVSFLPIYSDYAFLKSLANNSQKEFQLDPLFLQNYTNNFINKMYSLNLKTFLIDHHYIGVEVEYCLERYLKERFKNPESPKLSKLFYELSQKINNYKTIRGIEIGIHEFEKRKKKPKKDKNISNPKQMTLFNSLEMVDDKNPNQLLLFDPDEYKDTQKVLRPSRKK